jgi:hypothetical protein
MLGWRSVSSMASFTVPDTNRLAIRSVFVRRTEDDAQLLLVVASGRGSPLA